MKKSSIWKLLFSALTVFAVAVFAGCTDDNDDMGAPYLNVTPENLTFDAEGQPADEYNGTFIVETNRPWRAIVEDEQTWVRLSATEGEGDAAVTVTVPASNIGQSAKVTFEVYNSYGALIQKDVNVLQGEVVPPTLIFNETAGSESVANPYPLVADYTGWNTTGEGASKVSYEGVNTSIRASGKSSAGAYDGASGPNVIFFGSAPATFTVKNITLASGQTNLKLTFGGQYYDGDNNDNNFNKDNFVVYLSANGTDYTPLSYEVNDGDQVDPYWVFATKNFTLKNATSTLYIKFEAKASSKFRLDDITLMTGNGGEEIDLAGGGVVPPDPSGDAIYENNFDKTPAEKVDNKWPFLDQTDAWQNASGTGNSTVTYTSANVSVRTSGKLSGGYDGASGSNKIFFSSAPATFDINTITMPAGKTNYRIIFGGAYSQSNGGTYDNIFKPESFHVAVGNGTDWSGNLTYEKIGGSDTTDPYWVQFAVDFTLKEAVGQLSIRFTADLASVFAIDDVQLVEGNGGQEVDLEGGVVPPDPGEATAITIPELIAQMTDTEAPVDANADRYLDAVVMNDVAGANYTFNNLILATENATEAGNGITLVRVEPSTLGLNKGDKVRVTLYKGLAKVVNYSGMYEVTGAKEATWCKVEKTGTVTSIPTATIAAADLAKYQGMAVTIANASVAQAGVWASASALSSHTFTADGANFTVFCKQSDEKNPSVFLDVPFKAGSGNISGLAAVYKNNSQLVPRNLDDVAAFSDSSTNDPYDEGHATAWAELPEKKTDEDFIYVSHFASLNNRTVRNYSFCYDKTLHVAHWVAYPLHSVYRGSIDRTNDFQYDPKVDYSYQPNLVERSYTGSYDRGHQLPSADRTATRELNLQTFYATNMTPQLNRLNQDMWANLEAKVRAQICSDTLYVVTGCYYANTNTTTTDRDGKVCPVPTNYFKVLLRTRTGTTGKRIADCSADELKAIGFWVDQKSYGDIQPPASICMSVAEIEKKTGFTFFPNIPESAAKSVKAQNSPSQWGIQN